MRIVILSTLLLGCWAHDPNYDAQYINPKSVKGGGGQFQYRGGDNLVRFYNNTQSGYGMKTNLTAPAPVHRVGICYTEVPTASLARDPKHVPAGNGSRSDLSRIETCCAGYIRNIHNFHLCDPVCTNECVNALCTAPNTCTCFPDHVKNLAGFCVATCPIGCQNGHCAGGECLCKEGFELDRDGKFCVPRCRGNCGGVGNCTAPNTCACLPGYHSTPEGSCRGGAAPPSHQTCGSCVGGDCVGSECRCRPGYLMYKGQCQALCNPSCAANTRCVAPNVCSAYGPTPNQPSSNINHYPTQYPQYPNQPQNINNGQYPNRYPQNLNNTNHGQYPNQYPGSYPQNQNNTIHGQNNQYPGQYPYNQNNTIHGQYPNHYPGQNINNTISVNYPHPNGQSTYSYNQYSEQQNRTGHGEFSNTNTQYSNGVYPPQQIPIYAQYPNGQPDSRQQYPNQPNNTNGPYQGQYPQQPGQYPQQPSQYPQQPGQYPQQPGQYPQQPGQYPQQPGQQHLYPDLPKNEYPYPNQASNRTDGQVLYQNGYNPLENVTFNLHQGGQGHTQGQAQYGSQGQYGQGQYVPQGSNSQPQTGTYAQPGQVGSFGQLIPQGQYGQGQLSEGQQQSLNWSESCAQPCFNGNCVGTNRCECFPGYILDQADPTGTKCLPHCSGGCYNGVCSAPNTCVCLVGYHKDFSVKGRSGCVKRNRRSVEENPVNVAELLVFEIPDY